MKNFMIVTICLTVNLVNAQTYIGSKGVGSLYLSENNKFYLRYYNCGIDSGEYEKVHDKIILNSTIKPLKITKVECEELKDSVIYFSSKTVLIYDSLGKFKKIIDCKLESIGDSIFTHVNSNSFKKGDIIEFPGWNCARRIIWDNLNYEKCILITLDEREGQKIYFNNFILKVNKNKLTPVKSKQVDDFKNINKFYLSIFYKKSKIKNFKTLPYFSRPFQIPR